MALYLCRNFCLDENLALTGRNFYQRTFELMRLFEFEL